VILDQGVGSDAGLSAWISPKLSRAGESDFIMEKQVVPPIVLNFAAPPPPDGDTVIANAFGNLAKEFATAYAKKYPQEALAILLIGGGLLLALTLSEARA
jgi:hypothetical protein